MNISNYSYCLRLFLLLSLHSDKPDHLILLCKESCFDISLLNNHFDICKSIIHFNLLEFHHFSRLL
jgi:hypothetical protein